MTWATWLLSLAGPLVIRALLAIGVSVLTITGVDTAFGGLVSSAQSYYGGMPSAVLGLASLAGVPQALGIVFGAFNARLAMWLAVSATRWVTAK